MTIEIGIPTSVSDIVQAIKDESIEPSEVTTEKLSIIENGSTAVEKEVFYRAEDTDTSTTLSVDTGQFPKDYNSVIVQGTIAGHGAGSYDIVKIAVNNSTKTGYVSYLRDDNSISSITGVSHWLDEAYDQTHMDVFWKLGTQSPISNSNRGPSIRGLSSGHTNGRRLIDGYMNESDELPVDSVQVTTEWNAKCTLNFIGVIY